MPGAADDPSGLCRASLEELAGDEISVGGPILTAADAFDALAWKRASRQPMTPTATLDYLRTQTGSLLDARAYDDPGAVVSVDICRIQPVGQVLNLVDPGFAA